MNEVQQAKLLAASLKLTKAEIAKLRKEFKQLSEATLVAEGPTGPRGYEGPIGPQGEIGPRGFRGEKGEPGQSVIVEDIRIDENDELKVSLNNGAVFNLGSVVGPQGDKGDQGEQGIMGPLGEQGPQGIRGEVGPQGPQGDKGDRGEIGPRGPIGPRGDKGEKGERGIQGLIGPAGPQGETGPQGPVGPQGPQGEKGDQGVRGPEGQRGPQGIQGPQGPAGQDGGAADLEPLRKELLELFDDFRNNVSSQVTRLNLSRGGGGSSSGGGEVRLLRLDDVDTTNLADGRVLAYNASTGLLEFTTAGGGSVTNANNIGTGTGIFSNTVSDTLEFKSLRAGTNITISSNSSTITLGASGGAGAAAGDSLNIDVPNDTGQVYKVVAFDNNGNTVLASSKNIEQIHRVLGILDDNGETVSFGLIDNPSWSWANGQNVFLGDAGNLSTSSTINGGVFSLQIGNAINSTTVYVQLGTPVAL